MKKAILALALAVVMAISPLTAFAEDGTIHGSESSTVTLTGTQSESSFCTLSEGGVVIGYRVQLGSPKLDVKKVKYYPYTWNPSTLQWENNPDTTTGIYYGYKITPDSESSDNWSQTIATITNRSNCQVNVSCSFTPCDALQSVTFPFSYSGNTSPLAAAGQGQEGGGTVLTVKWSNVTSAASDTAKSIYDAITSNSDIGTFTITVSQKQ